MKFKNHIISGLLPAFKTGLGVTITIKRANKVAQGIKTLTDADIDAGPQITFIDPKLILNSHLKSLRLKN